MSLQEAIRYEQISAKAYEHPADRAATAAMRSIPMLDKTVKFLSGFGIERLVREFHVGNAVQISDRQVPLLWARHVHAASVLDVERIPALYVTQTPEANAFTIGAKQPMVVIRSGLVRDYAGSELDVVLAHEMGHVHSEHNYYQTALEFLRRIIHTSTGVPGFLPGIPIRAVYLVLLEWFRAAELSADRASALVVGDPLLTCQMLMRIAGGALDGMSLDAFLAQAARYSDEESLLTRWSRAWFEASLDHPIAVKRARELMSWVSDGSYDRIRAGNYVRRGQEPPLPRELDAATLHYRERFLSILQVTAGGVERLLGQLEDWLRSDSSSDSGDDDPSGGTGTGTGGGKGPWSGSAGRSGTKGRRS
jgi:Zn-dependent protease with chaperone function